MTTYLLSLYLPQGIRASLFMRDFSTPTFRKGKYQRFCQVNYTLRRRVHKPRHMPPSALLHNVQNIRICMGERTIVSVAYECTIIIDNNNNIIDSIRRSENQFEWHLLNGHKSARIRNPHRKEETHNLSKISRFLFKSFYIRRLQKQLFFLPYKSSYFERYATVPMVIFHRAWATCGWPD